MPALNTDDTTELVRAIPISRAKIMLRAAICLGFHPSFPYGCAPIEFKLAR
jgi:hypothetical protein